MQIPLPPVKGRYPAIIWAPPLLPTSAWTTITGTSLSPSSCRDGATWEIKIEGVAALPLGKIKVENSSPSFRIIFCRDASPNAWRLAPIRHFDRSPQVLLFGPVLFHCLSKAIAALGMMLMVRGLAVRWRLWKQSCLDHSRLKAHRRSTLADY